MYSNQHATLIQTKLNRPAVTSDLVPRTALLARLSYQWDKRPLTLIIAPAGYGKSTLLSSWLDTLPEQPSAWLSLEESDDDLTLFLTYVIAAIQTMFPHVGQETIALLNSTQKLPVRVLLATLVNELSTISNAYVLVLDDYYLIKDQAVQQFMSEFLRHMPSMLHLVLVSRTDPLLPVVQYRAKNKVTEIRAIDLRFSEQETSTFLRNRLGNTVDDEMVADIYGRSEGWVTGLHLATLSLRHAGRAGQLQQVIQKDDRFITDYLMAEVLADQTAVLQEWLLKTAVLDRFCPALCDALCQPTEETSPATLNGKLFIQQLISQNLFLIPLDAERNWYRYHHLFGHFLRQMLTQRHTKADVAALHTQASAWLVHNQFFEESLHHAIAAENMELAAQLVAEHRYKPLNDDQKWVLDKWLNKIPVQLIQQKPHLLLAKAWVANLEGAIWAIPPILDKVETVLKGSAIDPEISGELDLFNGILLFWDSQGEQSLTCLQQALDKIPLEHLGARNETETYIAAASQITGRGKAVIREYRQEIFHETTNSIRQARLLGALVFVHLLSGELPEAQLVAERLLDMAMESHNVFIEAWSYYFLGFVHVQRYELETAVSYFQQGVQKRYIMDANAPLDNYAGLILCYQAMGLPDKANETLAETLAFAQQANNPVYMMLARSVQIRLALWQGEIETAVSNAKHNDISDDVGTMLSWIETPRITYCRLLVAQGTEASLHQANEKLDALHQLAQTTYSTVQMIDILLLQTLAWQKQKRTEAALVALNEALLMAYDGGWKRPFVEAGSALLPLFAQLPADTARTPFTQTIREEIATRYGTQSLQNETLTYREMEVLALLAQELSNQEIATALTISPHTVKRHTSALYRKLAVKNRRQAVAEAKRAGLL